MAGHSMRRLCAVGKRGAVWARSNGLNGTEALAVSPTIEARPSQGRRDLANPTVALPLPNSETLPPRLGGFMTAPLWTEDCVPQPASLARHCAR